MVLLAWLAYKSIGLGEGLSLMLLNPVVAVGLFTYRLIIE